MKTADGFEAKVVAAAAAILVLFGLACYWWPL